jgi:hypothetical protein
MLNQDWTIAKNKKKYKKSNIPKPRVIETKIEFDNVKRKVYIKPKFNEVNDVKSKVYSKPKFNEVNDVKSKVYSKPKFKSNYVRVDNSKRKVQENPIVNYIKVDNVKSEVFEQDIVDDIKINVLNYASIIKKDCDKKNEVAQNSKKNSDIVCIPPLITDYKKCVRNYTPSSKYSSSYEAWEYVYAQHILDLKDIVVSMMSNLTNFKDTPNVDITFKDFGKFVYYCSSKYISPNIENLSEQTELNYMEYIINSK